ncbi:carboxylating nicotinate-nucleotide diphosphorylase [Alkalihalobacillus pseudalcaliphilus]|uniref:carboxylating nicotinate-nucleotide diphosphorylase n=1 Tax=Alkalihalobacillus pseudalcaliphilus TaxID=79884 RepID=UPI00064D7E3D|nr:carboxylating nicotinate-nucleotide diphosphorylase [Alkalihalobacillus pseudalcaliphilus]KMK75708.1 nicotinate-nucleotide pyrophosphorylase [Alkalihalobacillus pseudalcaliphilus]
MNQIKLEQQLRDFLEEDIGDGDITSQALPQGLKKTAYIFAKEDGVFVGASILKVGYSIINRHINVRLMKADGQFVEKGETVAEVTGAVDQLLLGERVFLNLIQRLSGIATLTKKSIEALNDPTIRVCDTRKTTPGLRMLEKYAVRCGGGFNHRRGLDQAVLLKENHLAAYGGIRQAVSRVKETLGHMTKIEVEITNKQELIDVIEAEVDVIMFDNYSSQQVKEQQPLVPSNIVTEVSGGISLKTIREFAGCGVNYISLGFLTHSYKAIDYSFLLK